MGKLMYKLSYESKGFKNVLYFENWNEAKSESEKKANAGYKVELKRRRVLMTLHHSALARGYVSKNCGRDEWYVGRFGQGFIRHWETRNSSCSNEYHTIEYYVEQK